MKMAILSYIKELKNRFHFVRMPNSLIDIDIACLSTSEAIGVRISCIY